MPTPLPTKTVCLNCNYEVKTENQYCPSCGQENADKRISLYLLLHNAFETVFNFESKIFQTVPLFLFYPGKLTTEFLEGKRVRYTHPFKIYLVTSLVFFFVITKLFTPSVENAIRNLDKNSEVLSSKLYDSTENNPSDSLSSTTLEKINYQQESIKDSITQLIKEAKNGNGVGLGLNIDSLDGLLKDSVALAEIMSVSEREIKEKNNSIRYFFTLIQNREMTPQALVDTLHNTNNITMDLQIAEQLLKIGRNDAAIFLANIINNVGTLMFFTLPLLALFFIPFYVRRKKYYIDHLIFTLHLQAFTFIILTVAALFLHWNLYFLSIISLLALVVYVWFAFKRVYQQSFFKTSIKAYLISILYITTLVFMLSINLVYSFYMF